METVLATKISIAKVTGQLRANRDTVRSNQLIALAVLAVLACRVRAAPRLAFCMHHVACQVNRYDATYCCSTHFW